MNVQEIIRAELASFFKKHAPEEAPEPEGATTEKDNVELDTKTPLTAALRAAGIETVEQLSAMQDLARAGEQALKLARAEHNRAAVAFFGQANASAVKSAQGWANSVNDLELLSATTERYLQGAPGADHQGQRLTKPVPEGNHPKNDPSHDPEFAASKIDPKAHYAAFEAGGRK